MAFPNLPAFVVYKKDHFNIIFENAF